MTVVASMFQWFLHAGLNVQLGASMLIVDSWCMEWQGFCVHCCFLHLLYNEHLKLPDSSSPLLLITVQHDGIRRLERNVICMGLAAELC